MQNASSENQTIIETVNASKQTKRIVWARLRSNRDQQKKKIVPAVILVKQQKFTKTPKGPGKN